MLIHLILPIVAIPTPRMRAAMDLGTGPVDPSMAIEVRLAGEILTANSASMARALGAGRGQGQLSGGVSGIVGRCRGFDSGSHLIIEAWGRELALVVIAMISVADGVGVSAEWVHHWERRIRILECRTGVAAANPHECWPGVVGTWVPSW